MKLSTRPQHRNPLSAAIAIVLATATVSPAIAFAQQATAPTDSAATSAQADQKKANELDKVTVTGYRYSIEKSLDQKRDANAIVDVITAEDVGKFPDKNVADALQRVPGVIISRDGGEGKNVSVRGLASDLTLTELNGNYVATAESNGDPTRSFNYTLMPSNMLSSAELFKTPEARIDEGGIGGTVILHTRRPLSVKSNSGFVNVEGSMADNRVHDKINPSVSAQYSWHDKSNRFGVLIGYTRQKREARTMGTSTEDYNWYGRDEGGEAVDVNGRPTPGAPHNYWGGTGFHDQNGGYYTHFAMPTSVDMSITNEQRERKGGQLTAQFKPTNELTFTANYFRFDLSQNSQTNTLKIPEWSLARFSGDGNWLTGRMLDGMTFDPSHTIVTGASYSAHPGTTYPCNETQAAALGYQPGGWGSDSCALPTPQITGSYNLQKARSQTFDLSVEWHHGPFDAEIKGGHTWAEGGPSLQFTLPIKPRKLISGAGTTSETWALANHLSAWSLAGTPSMTFSPDLMKNLQNGILEPDLGSTGSSFTRNSNHQNYVQADFTWHSQSSWLQSIQFGAKYRDGGISRNTGNTYWACPGTDPSNYANRFGQSGNPCPTLANQFPAYLLYSPNNTNSGAFNSNLFPAINYPAYIQYLNSTFGPMQTRNEPNFIYNVNEKISSAYAQANFSTERLRGNIGVRLVRTQQHADSTDQVDYYNAYFWRVGGALQPCSGAPATGAPTGSGCQGGFTTLPDDNSNPASGHTQSFVISSLNRSYNDVLPSLNVAYDITKDLVLRGAASKVISRPGYGDIASPGGLNYCSAQYVADHQIIGGGCQQGWTGSGSNKNLEPYKATQFDLGLEWYFHPGSILGGDLFRKNVSNFTVPVVQDVSMNVGGQTVTVQNYSTTAGGRNGVSEGVELYAQHTLDFGLGFQVNYTYNRTNEAAITLQDGTSLGKSPLVGSARNQANFTVFYETRKLMLRASYNRRGEVVDGLVNKMNVYEEPYQQIDLNAAYNFNDAFSISASVLNLTQETARSHLGSDTKDRFYSNSYSGRTMYLGATYKF